MHTRAPSPARSVTFLPALRKPAAFAPWPRTSSKTITNVRWGRASGPVFVETGGRGAKDMVILPYKDRLALFAKYLQQLVMESLGKDLRSVVTVRHTDRPIHSILVPEEVAALRQVLRNGFRILGVSAPETM